MPLNSIYENLIPLYKKEISGNLFFIFHLHYKPNLMKKFIINIVLYLFSTGMVYAQNNLPGGNLNGSTIILTCSDSCVPLSVKVPHLKAGTDYKVIEIPYAPFPYFVEGGTEDYRTYTTQRFSLAFSLPFNFCFYGQKYNQAVIGSIGIISFDASLSGLSCPLYSNYQLPLPPNSNLVPRAAIMGMYSNLSPARFLQNEDTTLCTSPFDRKIQWRVEGTAPKRKFIVSYYKIGSFGNDSSATYISPCFFTPNTFQIVLHETSGLIDVHIGNRTCLPVHFYGNAILGIQDWSRAKSVTAPGKNSTLWTAHHESYRFIPSDSASRFLGAEILDMAGNSLAFADTATSLPGLLDLQFQNICPGPTLTKYIIKTRFLTCQAAEEFITLDTINVVRKYHLPATASVVPATCGNNSGSISIIVTDSLGVPPYQYAINGGSLQNSNTFTGLYAGSYPVLVVDSRGCDTAFTVSVNGNATLSHTLFVKNAFCAAVNNTGSVTITPTTGIGPYFSTLTGPGGPYTYSGNGPIVFNNLAAGTYTYNFSDAFACPGIGGNVVVGFNTPIKPFAKLDKPLCNGNADGAITFMPAGGIYPYTYSINNGASFQDSSNFTLLAAGTHHFIIKDSAGCTKDTSIVLTQPLALVATASLINAASCFGNDGKILVSITGGTPKYWTAVNGSFFRPDTLITAPVGTYPFITAMDINGCKDTVDVPLTIPLNDTMRLSLEQSINVCEGSSATLYPVVNDNIPGNAFAWHWGSVNAASTIANDSVKNAVVSPVDTSVYFLHASWGLCHRFDTITANLLYKPRVKVGNDTIICFGNTALLNGRLLYASGPVNFNWHPPNFVNNIYLPVTFANPATAGTHLYALMVQDNYGCNFFSADTLLVTVLPRVPVFAGNDSIAVLGEAHQLLGSGGLQYTWAPADVLNNAAAQNPIAVLYNDTRFTLRVMDIAGCTAMDTVLIKVLKGPAYYVPTAFSPNADGRNDIFRPIPAGISSTKKFSIYNRYGTMVFETSQWLKGWDGRYKGQIQPPGAYIWFLNGMDKNGKIIQKKGTVILIK